MRIRNNGAARRGLRRLGLLVAGLSLGALTVVMPNRESAALPRAANPFPDDLLPVGRELDHDGNPYEALRARFDSADVSSQTVFPPDDRVQITNPAQTPFRAFVELLMYRGSTFEASCSGSMINYNVVLTAAHCLWPRDEGDYYTKVLVVPSSGPVGPNLAPWGVAAATRFSVPRGWANITSDNAALAYDVGLVHLDGQPFSSQLAPYLTIAAAPDSFFTSRTGLATAGYPGDKPPGTMWGTSTYDYFVGADTVYTQLDVYFGQSGSPIYTFTNPPSSGYVISVVSYGNSTYNGSIRFTASWLAAMRQWCTEMGCTFATGTIAEPVYTMSAAAFCTSSAACTAGAEPLVAGQPIRLGFRISPNPTQQVHADLLWNGTQFSQVQWDLPYSAGGTFSVDREIRLPAGASSGTLTARVWVGSANLGSVTATIAAPTSPSVPSVTPSPTATATPKPAGSPVPGGSPVAGPDRRGRLGMPFVASFQQLSSDH